MASNIFCTLPLEIISRITQDLNLECQKSLSSVDSCLRHAVAVELFHTVRVSNTQSCLQTVPNLIKKHGQYVKTILFVGIACPQINADDGSATVLMPGRRRRDLSKLPLHPLSKPLADILAGTQTPFLHALRVHFAFNWANPGWNYFHPQLSDDSDDDGEGAVLSDDSGVTEKPDSDAEELPNEFDELIENECASEISGDMRSMKQLKKIEAEHQWRALMAETWRAVSSRGQQSTVEKLHIKVLVPKKTPTFFTSSWRTFLAGLVDIEVDVLVFEHGHYENYSPDILDGYLHFVRSLDEILIDHLRDVKTMKFVGSSRALIGSTGMHHTPLPLKPQVMNCLHTLELKNIIIGPELITFCRSHRSTLETLRLIDCHSEKVSIDSTMATALDAISWTTFFRSLDEGGEYPGALRKLVIEPRYTVFIRRVAYTLGRLGGFMAEKRPVRKILERSKGSRVFSYGRVRPENGRFELDTRYLVHKFIEDEDFREYEKLERSLVKKGK